ncbi:MAG: aldehyde dehydrogenase [Elusimicrobiota bacterium]
METSEISLIVSEVVKRLELSGTLGSGEFVFQDLDAAVELGSRAQAEFQEMGLKARDKIIAAMRKAAVENAQALARMAREETGMGRCEDKIQKNLLAAQKTPGVECLHAGAYTGDKGLTLVEYAPFGIVGAVTPSTNPTSTVINNAISILAAGNSVIFAPHPAAVKCSREAMRLLSEAAVSAGAPHGLITTIDPPSQDNARAVLAHPKVRVNLVTGGPAIVKVAMTIGKACKTIAAGPGNPPAVVDETALLPKAAQDIVSGASFDNGVLCTAEKETIVVAAIRDRFLDALRQDPRAFELNRSQMDAVTKLVIVEGGKGCREPRMNRDYVGRDASVIAKGIGLRIPEKARLLWAEVPNDHPFVWTEQLMPVMPVTVAPDLDSAIALAYEVEREHHTAVMHSTDIGNLTKMGRRMACSIYVKNAPSYYGLGMGEGYATLSIGTPTGDGLVKATHFARPLHCCLVGYGRIA